jgi:hypothetical protein
MKTTKKLQIIQAILMYVLQLPILLLAVFITFNIHISDDLSSILIKVALLLYFIVLIPLSIVTLIAGFLTGNKADISCIKTTMILKILLIPWFINNFIICFCIWAGTLNPFLFLAGPILIFLFIINTYLFMISLSATNIINILTKWTKKELPTSTELIVILIFHFCFCLDVIASILYYNNLKKINVEVVG